jgi:hypothetical protein
MTQQPTKQLLRDVQLSERYGRTPRTISTWKREKILPPPDITINGNIACEGGSGEAHYGTMTRADFLVLVVNDPERAGCLFRGATG